MLDAIHQQSDAALRHLAAALRSGSLATGISTAALSALLGGEDAALWLSLNALREGGFQPSQIAVLCDSILRARHGADDLGREIELIVSGPDTPGTPTGDTAATMHALISEAVEEVLIVGYAVHQGRQLFAPIADRMRAIPSLRVVFCLNIARQWGDKTRSELLVARFRADFVKKNWPWKELPHLRYDPRALETETVKRGSLHAKCVLVDRTVALISSANFTEAAQERNIEVGLTVRHPALAQRLGGYFDELYALGILKDVP